MLIGKHGIFYCETKRIMMISNDAQKNQQDKMQDACHLLYDAYQGKHRIKYIEKTNDYSIVLKSTDSLYQALALISENQEIYIRFPPSLGSQSSDEESNRDKERDTESKSNRDKERDAESKSNRDKERDTESKSNRDKERDTESKSNRDKERDTESKSNRDKERDTESKSNRDIEGGRDSVKENINDNNKIKAILSYSKLFYRHVYLSQHWSYQCQGPLLGFSAATHRPIAIIPKGYNTYWSYDAAFVSPIKISPLTQSLVDDSAYLIIKPFENPKVYLSELLHFAFKGTLREFGLFFMFGLLTAIIALLSPVLTQYIFDDVIMMHGSSQLLQIFFILVGLLVPVFLFELVKRIALLNCETQADNRVQMGYWDRILKLPVSFFRKMNAGEAMSRVGNLIRIRTQLAGSTLLFVLDLHFYRRQCGVNISLSI